VRTTPKLAIRPASAVVLLLLVLGLVVIAMFSPSNFVNPYTLTGSGFACSVRGMEELPRKTKSVEMWLSNMSQ